MSTSRSMYLAGRRFCAAWPSRRGHLPTCGARVSGARLRRHHGNHPRVRRVAFSGQELARTYGRRSGRADGVPEGDRCTDGEHVRPRGPKHFRDRPPRRGPPALRRYRHGRRPDVRCRFHPAFRRRTASGAMVPLARAGRIRRVLRAFSLTPGTHLRAGRTAAAPVTRSYVVGYWTLTTCTRTTPRRRA